MVTVITAVPGNVPRVVEDDDQRVAAPLVCYIGGRLILKILLAKQADDLGFRAQYPDWGSREFWIRETADFRIQLDNIRRSLETKEGSWTR